MTAHDSEEQYAMIAHENGMQGENPAATPASPSMAAIKKTKTAGNQPVINAPDSQSAIAIKKAEKAGNQPVVDAPDSQSAAAIKKADKDVVQPVIDAREPPSPAADSRLKIRIRFRKWGVMKFIGHLDMMRYFQKAIRRAGIDICLSEGFSPHQIMSFAAPLGVGITSDGEYFDIEVHSTGSTEASIAALNAVMVDGVEITGYVLLPEKAKTAMSLVAAADYRLTFKQGADPLMGAGEWQKIIDEYFNGASEFVITKQTKKSRREVNLKPLVYRFEAAEYDSVVDGDYAAASVSFLLSVSTGSTDNIKPELVLSSLCRKAGLSDITDRIHIHRLETYGRDEASGQLIPLLDMGQVIP